MKARKKIKFPAPDICFIDDVANVGMMTLDEVEKFVNSSADSALFFVFDTTTSEVISVVTHAGGVIKGVISSPQDPEDYGELWYCTDKEFEHRLLEGMFDISKVYNGF